jgi:hypothetical protein
MDEAEQFCDRLFVAHGSSRELITRYATTELARLDTPAPRHRRT